MRYFSHLLLLAVLLCLAPEAYGQASGRITAGDGPIPFDGPIICGNLTSYNAGLCFTHDNSAGINAHLIVDDIAARDAIPTRFRGPHMVVHVRDDGTGTARAYAFPSGADTPAELENADWIEEPVSAALRALAQAGGGGGGATSYADLLGTIPAEDVPEAAVTQHQDALALLASQVVSGTLGLGRIPVLPASQIGSGTLDPARLPNFSASLITSGTVSIQFIDDRMATDTELDGATFWEPQAARSASFTLGGAGTSTGDPGQYPITGSATITLPTPLSLGASVERADTYEFFADGGNYTIQVQDDGTSSLSQTCVGVDEVGEGIIIWPRSDTAWRVFCRVNEAEGQAGAVAAVDLTDIEGDGGGAVDYTAGHYLRGTGAGAYAEGPIQLADLPSPNATDAEVAASQRRDFVEIATATVNPILAQENLVIYLTSTSAQTVELPSNATQAFPLGSRLEFKRTSATGDHTFTNGSGAALDGSCTLDANREYAYIRKYDTNAWTVDGCGETQARTDEQIEDVAGAMVSGNTETLIAVTYQSADNTLDFVVDPDLANYDNTTSNFATKASLDAKADLAVASAVETGSFTVSAGQVGEVIRVTGTGPYTATIPAGLTDGGSLLFWNETSNDLTISGASAAYAVPAGESAAFIESKDAVDEWNRLPGGGSAAGVTFEALDASGDVGTGAAQVAAGDHGHTESDISDLSHTVDTNAATECNGSTTYMDGDGGCDDISSVYEAADAAIAKTDEEASWTNGSVGAAQGTISQTGGTLNWNLTTDQSAVTTLTAGATLANPTGQVAGHTYLLLIKQDATGGRTLAYGTAYNFPGGTAPTLTTTANGVDMISCLSDGTDMFCTSALDFQ